MRTFFKILILLVACVFFGEVLLRLVPNKYNNWHGTIRFKNDEASNLIYVPIDKGSLNTECFKINPIFINSKGFRDAEWDDKNNSDFKIAILGDSFMSACQVANDANTSAILEKLLKVDVFNSGVAGYGTIRQLYIFKKYLKALKPNIVVLFLLPNNDIRENSCMLNKEMGFEGYPCGKLVNSKLEIETKTLTVDLAKNKFSGIKHMVGNLLKNSKLYYIYLTSQNKSTKVNKIPGDWYVYMPPVSREWKEAWDIEEMALAEVKKEVEESGGKLVIAIIPDYLRISRHWKDDFIKETGLAMVPPEFDPSSPVAKIINIAEQQKISYVDLGPFFKEYSEKFNLEAPYYSYWCDGHWNPLGHFMASNILAKFLINDRMLLLSEEDSRSILKKINTNMASSPVDILGKEAYRQIYKHKVYLGRHKIAGFLNN